MSENRRGGVTHTVYLDLIYCHEIVFELVDLKLSDFFELVFWQYINPLLTYLLVTTALGIVYRLTFRAYASVTALHRMMGQFDRATGHAHPPPFPPLSSPAQNHRPTVTESNVTTCPSSTSVPTMQYDTIEEF